MGKTEEKNPELEMKFICKDLKFIRQKSFISSEQCFLSRKKFHLSKNVLTFSFLRTFQGNNGKFPFCQCHTFVVLITYEGSYP